MRIQADKKHFTKAERKFVRWAQENRIPFKTKVKINSREIDFLVGRYAIDIDCHGQAPGKNEMLVREGYIPIHYTNEEIKNKKYESYKFS